MLKSYQELMVWQKGVELSISTHRLTSHFPKSDLYGISNQIRRAALSIPSNIAEGYMRNHRKEYVQFLRVAFGSGAELETQLLVAKKLNLAPKQDFSEINDLLAKIMKMLNKLTRSLNPTP